MATTSATVELLLKARDESAEAIESFKGRFESLKSLLETAFVWRAGERLFDAAIEGVKEFGSALIGENIHVETLRTSLTALYGSATEASAAIEYMGSFSLKAPFAKDDVEAAGQQIISFGQDITEVMTPLGNVAAAMGVSLPVAASALEKAIQTGSFRGLTSQLHVTKAELEQFGLVVSATGKVDLSTLLGAFERLGNAKFAGAMAAQANTFAGAAQNLKNQFAELAEAVGRPIFLAIESDMAKLAAFLQAHQADITRFTDLFGTNFAVAGRLVGQAFAVIDGAIATFVNWFSTAAMPIIETTLGNVAIWWESHAAKVETAISTIMADVSGYAAYVEQQAGNMMEVMTGIFEAGWGIASIVFTTAVDLLSGDWSNFAKDFNDGALKIQIGVIDMVAGVMSAIATLAVGIIGVGATIMLPLADGLMEPWTKVARGIRNLVVGIATLLADMVAGLVAGMNAATNVIANGLNAVIDKYNGGVGKIPFFGNKIAVPKVSTVDPMANVQAAYDATLAWGTHDAPGITQSQSIVAGASQPQAAADIAAQQKAILDPVVASLEATRKALIQQYGLDGGGGTSAAQARGKSLLDPLTAAINALLHPMGGGGPTVKDDGGLPGRNGLGGGTIGAPGTTTAPGAGSQRSPTGRVPLGQLGADFMSSLASGGRLGSGTDPATRAAQQQASQQLTQISQGDKHTQLLEAQNAVLGELARAAQETRDFLARLVGPHHTPMNPLVVGGVGRPVL